MFTAIILICTIGAACDDSSAVSLTPIAGEFSSVHECYMANFKTANDIHKMQPIAYRRTTYFRIDCQPK